MKFIADGIERAGSADRAAIIEALSASKWDGHFMPYGPTEIVDGQNMAATPLVMQVQGSDIEVVAPAAHVTKPAKFPFA